MNRLSKTVEERRMRRHKKEHFSKNRNGGWYIPGQALPAELRIRICDSISKLFDADGNMQHGNITDLALQYKVSRSTIYRLLRRVDDVLFDLSEITSIELLFGGYYGNLHGDRKLDAEVIYYIILLLKQFPSLYMVEIKHLFLQHWNIDISTELIRSNLQYLGLTRKKFTRIAEQRTTPHILNLRAQYSQFKELLNPDYLYFYDESGFKPSDSIRSYGWSDERRIITTVQTSYGTNYNLLALFSLDGIIAAEVFSGTVTGARVLFFFQNYGLPTIRNNSFVMDNHKMHHGATGNALSNLLLTKNCLLAYIPPYSPDYNPIENAFGTIKFYLKDRPQLYRTNPIQAILQASQKITSNQAAGWFQLCGYH